MKRVIAFARLGVLVVLMALLQSGCASHAMEPRLMTDQAAMVDADRKIVQVAAESHKAENAQRAPLEAPKPDPDRADRIIIYTAELSLVVNDVTGAQRAVENDLKPLGAYMQRMDGHAIVMKIPAARFNEAIAIVEKLGEVTNKAVTGEDVTEEMRDLNIRLKNALDVRDRLAKLLEQAAKMEDALKIEKELERIAETIELCKGKIRFLETNAAFSTLTVKLNSPLPQHSVEMEVPFAWVRELGQEVGAGSTGVPDVPWLGSGVSFDLPEGFIKYLERDHVTRAMSGDGVLIFVSRHENYSGGTQEFWTPYIRRALVAGRVFSMKDEPQVIQLKRGRSAVCMAGSKSIGPRRYGYLLALVVLKDYVYTFEAWGEEEAFEAQKPKLMEAVESLRP